MSGKTSTGTSNDTLGQIAVLSEPRRNVLAIVAERGRIAVGDLAEAVVDRESNEDTDDGSDRDRRVAETRLVHVDLPKLVSYGAVAFDRETGVVERTADPIYASPMVDAPDSADAVDASAVELFTNERRHAVMSVLRSRSGAIEISELALRVAALEQNVPVAEVSQGHQERVRISLHHAHLPKLAAANVVEYHPTDGEVTLCTGGPDRLANRLPPGAGTEDFRSETPLS